MTEPNKPDLIDAAKAAYELIAGGHYHNSPVADQIHVAIASEIVYREAVKMVVDTGRGLLNSIDDDEEMEGRYDTAILMSFRKALARLRLVMPKEGRP